LVELLAPAGTWQSFKAAVESGANAIYLAGKNFGARAFADNFDEEKLQEAVEYAHLRNTAVHVTVNTLIDNNELPALADYLIYLYNVGVDAIIVQDLAVAKLAQKIVPDLPLHASTQMSVNNLSSVKMLEKLNFTRVVLAREVSLKDIEYICQNTSLEIETFIHGAICVCYSGQCLMSSMIGGRSGNRGRCAQPCRLPYTLVDEQDNDLLEEFEAGQYLLSPRDMKTIDMIPELIKAGVSSFKIEGRMKKPEYVAIVVNAYRNKIDSYYDTSVTYNKEQTDKELSQIFNRDFTTAYLANRPGKNMISDRKPNNRGMLIGRVQEYDYNTHLAQIKLSDDLSIGDKIDFWVKVGGRVTTNVTDIKLGKNSVSCAHKNDIVTIKLPAHVHEHDRVFKVFDINLSEKAKTYFNTSDPVRKINLQMTLQASVDQPVHLSLVDDDNISVDIASEFIAQAALKRPLTYDTVHKQMVRLGNTIYNLHQLTCSIGENVMVPMSVLNELRRQGIEVLLAKRLQNFERPATVEKLNIKKDFFTHKNNHTAPTQLFVAVDTVKKVAAAVKHNCSGIIFGGDSYTGQIISNNDYNKAISLCHNNTTAIYISLPRILRQNQMDYIDTLLNNIAVDNIDGIYVHTLGQLHDIQRFCQQYDMNIPIWSDFSVNIFNNISLNVVKDLDISGVVLSPELTLQQIKNITSQACLPTEVIVHGHIELMVSEYCIPGSFLGDVASGKCSRPCQNNHFYLKDRKNEHFPVITDQFCHMHILNGRELVMLSHLPDLSASGIDRLRIDGRYMDCNKLDKIVKLYKEVLAKGKYHKLFQNNNMLEEAEGSNFTRGHFFRGILSND